MEEKKSKKFKIQLWAPYRNVLIEKPTSKCFWTIKIQFSACAQNDMCLHDAIHILFKTDISLFAVVNFIYTLLCIIIECVL